MSKVVQPTQPPATEAELQKRFKTTQLQEEHFSRNQGMKALSTDEPDSIKLLSNIPNDQIRGSIELAYHLGRFKPLNWLRDMANTRLALLASMPRNSKHPIRADDVVNFNRASVRQDLDSEMNGGKKKAKGYIDGTS